VCLLSGGVNPLGELANILQANESIADKGEGMTLRLGSDDLKNGFEEECQYFRARLIATHCWICVNLCD